jgi:hypothetical protein
MKRMRFFMRWIIGWQLALVMTGCNVGFNNASGPIITPATNPEVTNRSLMIAPIVQKNGSTFILQPGAVVTITWQGIPTGSNVTFQLSNTLEDGGIRGLGADTDVDAAGASLQFTVPERLKGEIFATVAISGSNFNITALPLAVETAPTSAGACDYLPAALGSGETLYAEPDVTKAALGKVIFDGKYVVVAVALGVGDKGAEAKFWEIQDEAGARGWVLADAGGTQVGDCVLFE